MGDKWKLLNNCYSKGFLQFLYVGAKIAAQSFIYKLGWVILQLNV